MNIIDKIESTKEQLNALVNKETSLTKELVVNLSQELDLLINEYYQQCC